MAAGARLFPYDYQKRAQRGGLRHYPLSGVKSGLEITDVTYNGTDTTIAEITLNAGEVLLDSEPVSVGSFSPLQITTSTDLSTTEVFFDLWLNPTRIVPYFTDLNNKPTVSNVDPIKIGDNPERKPKEIKLSLHCADMGDYLVKQQEFYSVNQSGHPWDTGGNWEPVNDIRKIVWTRGNQNQYPLNIVKNEATASNFTLDNPEKEIFHSTQKKPYLNSHAMAVLRQPGSIKLGVLYYDGAGNGELYEDTSLDYLIQFG